MVVDVWTVDGWCMVAGCPFRMFEASAKCSPKTRTRPTNDTVTDCQSGCKKSAKIENKSKAHINALQADP